MGIKSNPYKIEIGKAEMTFFGQILTFKIDPNHVKTVVEMLSPSNRSEL